MSALPPKADISAPGRQGAFMSTRPKLVARTWRGMGLPDGTMRQRLVADPLLLDAAEGPPYAI